MKRRLRLAMMVACAGVLLGTARKESARRLCAGFLPENSVKIPIGAMGAGGITHKQFDRVLDRVQQIYGPIVAAKGGELVIQRDWDDPTLNAYAMREGSHYVIHLFGGLARHPDMTEDGFTLVVCHELGHHLGGRPIAWISQIFGISKLSIEGQADYFATTKCMRRFFSAPTSVASLASSPEEAVAGRSCAGVFKNAADQALCVHGTMSGVSLARLLGVLNTGTRTPSLSTPDKHQVRFITMSGHPPAQCRLDTYFQGALCAKPITEDFSFSSAAPGACTPSQGYTTGDRPHCWYHPPYFEPDSEDIAQLEPPAAARRIDAFRAGDSYRQLKNGDVWQGM